MAVGALHAAADRGLRVPHDLSVAGFDDIDVARAAHPALTTVRQPLGEMGRMAVSLLGADARRARARRAARGTRHRPGRPRLDRSRPLPSRSMAANDACFTRLPSRPKKDAAFC